MSIRYDKLVRDKIPDISRAAGRRAEVRVAAPEEELKYLLAKLNEEVAELQAAPSAEECADVLEVLHAIAGMMGVTPAQLEALREKKARERGGFERRVVLVETE